MTATRRSFAYTTQSVAPFVVVTVALSLVLGGAGLAVAMVLGLPWFAFRYDNQSGAFFVLALISVIILAVLVLLIMLMAIAH
jgi:hypothetical protein